MTSFQHVHIKFISWFVLSHSDCKIQEPKVCEAYVVIPLLIFFVYKRNIFLRKLLHFRMVVQSLVYEAPICIVHKRRSVVRFTLFYLYIRNHFIRNFNLKRYCVHATILYNFHSKPSCKSF